MLHLREVVMLQEGEHLVSVLRRSVWTTAPRLACAALLIAAPFFLLFPLIRMGFIGTVILSASLALGFYFGLKAILIWDANALILTSHRFIVVRQEGLWSRRVVEAALAGAQASAKTSIWPRLGTVTISGQGLSEPVSITAMPVPHAIVRVLHGLRDAQSAGFKVRTV